jgi:hypothetical protein
MQERVFCKETPFPEKKIKQTDKVKSVYGVLLPESGDKPILVEVEVAQICNESDFDSPEEREYFDSPNMQPFLGSAHTGRNMTQCNLKKKTPYVCELTYRDNFFADGSKPNMAIRRLTANRNPHDWRGPMLITKQSFNREYLESLGYES